jgi:hypothetical protein
MTFSRSEILTAMLMNIQAFWDMTPRKLTESYPREFEHSTGKLLDISYHSSLVFRVTAGSTVLAAFPVCPESEFNCLSYSN